MIKNYLKIALILSLGLILINCEGEDGAAGLAGTSGTDGINGTDGTSGTDGTDGANGNDGTNGDGFDELTKYGAVAATLTGTRPDDEAFTQTSNFKFTSSSGQFFKNNGEIQVNGDDIYFTIIRSIDPTTSFGPPINQSTIYLTVNDAGLATQSFEVTMYINNLTIVSEDLKQFTLSSEFEDDGSGITNYSFDNTTNTLSFSYSFEDNGFENSTGELLNISGEVNVILLESIDQFITSDR